MTCKLTAVVAASLALSSVEASAQSAAQLSITVEIASVSQHGDTLTVGYRLLNGLTSPTSLESFTLPRAVPLVAALPRGEDWLVLSHSGRRDVVKWTALDSMIWAPGAQSDTLWYTGIGTLGISRAWIYGWRPTLTEADVADAESAGRSLSRKPIWITTLNIVPPGTSNTTSGAMVRLDSLLASSCVMGWISPRGVCNSLRQKMNAVSSSLTRGDTDAAKGQLNALLNELEAQRGKQISAQAYWLLRTGASRLLNNI